MRISEAEKEGEENKKIHLKMLFHFLVEQAWQLLMYLVLQLFVVELTVVLTWTKSVQFLEDMQTIWEIQEETIFMDTD